MRYSRQYINRIIGWPRDDKGNLVPPGRVESPEEYSPQRCGEHEDSQIEECI